jgi:magnesium-transporting ATPase (P-type)
MRYHGESPDELALVSGAAQFGGRKFVGENSHGKKKVVSLSREGAENELFDLLYVLAFTSDRKMMSVVVRCRRTQAIMLLSKGADQVSKKTVCFL